MRQHPHKIKMPTEDWEEKVARGVQQYKLTDIKAGGAFLELLCEDMCSPSTETPPAFCPRDIA